MMKEEITEKEGLKDKLLKGLDLAYERMIVEKRKKQQKIVVWKEGKIVTITP
ncbi:hypothetical protein [Capnocytophaga leadbetteri]|uniref:hypothetical protein n=1 Tax=Capnocytophaga leadbetteri TaxID=327575 RepID=UPI0028E89476|nr:hypothetical protein [Capnocytophaga leadbetteri]